MGLMSWGMGSTAVSASPQQRRKFGSYFQKVKWYSWFTASPGEDGALPCPDSRYNWFRRGWVCLLYRIVGLFMYKLTFSLQKIFLKSQCIYRDCFHFSNSALGTRAVKAGKWEELGSYYTPANFWHSQPWLTWEDWLFLDSGWVITIQKQLDAHMTVQFQSAREKGLRTWKGCKRIFGL